MNFHETAKNPTVSTMKTTSITLSFQSMESMGTERVKMV